VRELAARIRSALAQTEGADTGFWPGHPLLVTENAPDLDLNNGDVGLVLPGDSGLVAVFAAALPGQPPVRELPLARLPATASALAMTVHKCQGSQFARVALVLAGRPSPIQTRELVYTGLTRARDRLDWLGGRGELERALGRRVERASGLGPLLRAAPGTDS
jgi:exodeoxyribonuclease V alpha subunit